MSLCRAGRDRHNVMHYRLYNQPDINETLHVGSVNENY